MKRVIFIIVAMLVANSSIAASAKCSAKAADVYYNKVIPGDRDFVLSGLRSGTGGKLSPVEIATLNGLIYSCEKGIENKNYNINDMWNFNYNNARNSGISDVAAKSYADAHSELYQYGKSIK
ncbi:hypothetical protein ACRS85_03795 [Pluralibacter gergoviae]|uniref:hypothetical protein n=1 Tax=Pluralibacter gergoviae TaxID=61647 RepID=UPI003EDEBEFE